MMHWKLYDSETMQQYQLMSGHEEVASLKCNPATGSLRLDYGVKRLFFLNAVRGLKKKLAVTNEYGYVVARYTQPEPGTATIEMADRTFLCTTDGQHVIIYDDRNEELLQCIMPDASAAQIAALLFASLWLVRENVHMCDEVKSQK